MRKYASTHVVATRATSKHFSLSLVFSCIPQSLPGGEGSVTRELRSEGDAHFEGILGIIGSEESGGVWCGRDSRGGSGEIRGRGGGVNRGEGYQSPPGGGGKGIVLQVS